jgi:hypothetical protein
MISLLAISALVGILGGILYFIGQDPHLPYVRAVRHLVFYGLLLIQPVLILVLLRLIFINDILPYIIGV